MLIQTLDYLMQIKNINKNILAKESGIPYTTIDGLYKKGAKNVKLSTLLRLCEYFQVTLDYLVKGYDFSVSDAEKRIILAYRSKPEMQPAVDKLLGITDDNKNEKLTLMTESEPKKITNRGRAVAFGGKSKNIELTEEQEKAVAEALSRLSKKTE